MSTFVYPYIHLPEYTQNPVTSTCCAMLMYHSSFFKGKHYSAFQDTCVHTISSLKLYLDVQAIKSFLYWVTFQAEFRSNTQAGAACCRVEDSRKPWIQTSIGFLFLFGFFSFCLKKMNNETEALISLKDAMKRLLRATGREQAQVFFSRKKKTFSGLEKYEE